MGKLRTARPLLIAVVLATVLKLGYVAIAAWMAPDLAIDAVQAAHNRDAVCTTCGLGEHLIPQSASAAYRFTGVWQRFDTLWYVKIASVGYDNPVGIVFFPLYPMLIRVVMPVLRNDVQAALAVAFLSCILLFWALLRLVELDFGRDVALRTLAVVALWPSSFILFAGYADSLMMALMLAAIYFSRTGKPGLGAAAGLLAGLAKSIGVLAAVPMLIYAWRERSWRAALSAMAPAAGYLAFTAYLRQAGFDSLTETYVKHWATRVSAPWDTVGATITALGTGNPMLIINAGLLVIIAVLVVAKPVPPAYWAYALALIFLFLAKRMDNLLASTARHVVAVYPAFVNLARTKDWAWWLILPGALNLWMMIAFLKWMYVV